jgi:hypothetical protein
VLASSLNLFFERFSSPLPVFFSKFLHDFLMTINTAKGGQRLLLAMESGPTEDQDRRSEPSSESHEEVFAECGNKKKDEGKPRKGESEVGSPCRSHCVCATQHF